MPSRDRKEEFRNSTQKISTLIILFVLSANVLFASTPAGLVNYQGILRDNSDQPLSGTFDMVFRFYDAPSGGSLLLTDAHFSGGAVNVINGLFDVALGSGSIIPAGAIPPFGIMGYESKGITGRINTVCIK